MTEIEPSGFFGWALSMRMAKSKLTPRSLASEAGCTYESVRRFINGSALPSSLTLNRVRRATRTPIGVFELAVSKDRARNKLKASFWLLANMHEGMAPIYYVWDYLTPPQKSDIALLVKRISKENASTREDSKSTSHRLKSH